MAEQPQKLGSLGYPIMQGLNAAGEPTNVLVGDDGKLAAGGGGLGGGSNIYSNVMGDFVATANSGAKTITLSGYASSVLSAVLTSENFLASVILRRNSSGVVDTLPMTNVLFAANVLTLSGMAANFAGGDTVAVFVPGPEKGMDEADDARIVKEKYAPQAEDNSVGVFKTQMRAPYSNITADTAVKTGSGFLHGWIVNSHTSGTVKIWDNTAASGAVICNTITFPAGSSLWVLPVAIPFSTGCYFDIGGTVDITPLVS